MTFAPHPPPRNHSRRQLRRIRAEKPVEMGQNQAPPSRQGQFGYASRVNDPTRQPALSFACIFSFEGVVTIARSLIARAPKHPPHTVIAPRRPPKRGFVPPISLAALTLGIMVVVLAFSAGCKCFRGPVNASPALRWWLFSNFGAGRICPEMTKSGMGLKIQDRGPSVGRFFPQSCSVKVNGDNKTVTVSFAGTGYAHTPVTGRVGFQAQATIEYRPEFYMGEDNLYVWGKVNRIVHGPVFQLGYVQNRVADIATAVTPMGSVANTFGQQITAGELTRGFTVLQNYDNDSKVFALGIINPPRKPHTPYQVDGEEAHTYANETIEVQYQQRDYLGPFEVVDSDQRLTMKMFLQGPDVEALVVNKPVGDRWREHYQLGRPMGPPPGPIMAGSVIRQGAEARASWRLPPGQYYVVIDHTSQAGQVNPPATGLIPNPLGGPVARLSYVAQLVED